MHGGDGDDALSGAVGNDFLEGDTGEDSMHGGKGDDRCEIDVFTSPTTITRELNASCEHLPR